MYTEQIPITQQLKTKKTSITKKANKTLKNLLKGDIYLLSQLISYGYGTFYYLTMSFKGFYI